MRQDAIRRAIRLESLRLPMRIARSQPSSTRSTSRSLRPSSTVTRGWRCANSASRGAICRVPNETGALSRSSPLGSTRSAATAASAASISARMRPEGFQVVAASLGDREPPRRAVEQLDAQAALEGGNMLGDHGLRHAERPGGGGKAAGAGNSGKNLKASQAVQHWLISLCRCDLSFHITGLSPYRE